MSLGPIGESDEGQPRLGLTLGLPIPLLNANRRAIAEAHANREQARLEAERTYQQLAHERARALARHEALASLHEALVSEVAPLVEAQRTEIDRLAAIGELNALLVGDALDHMLEWQLDVADALLRAALTETELRYLTPTASEDSQ